MCILWACAVLFSNSDSDVRMGGTYTMISLLHLWTVAVDMGNKVLSDKGEQGREQPKGTAPAGCAMLTSVGVGGLDIFIG
jgi:hypothetical protein